MTLKTKETPGNTSWFVHDRFGMFIHWGLYALPARHEWVKSREQINDEEYQKYFKHFDPDLYDPDLWAEAASNAGMKYFVVTTKHHEGFCMWDSDLTDYKSTNTPCGKDLLDPMVKAFRGRDMKVGFYHSLIDWHHPEYVIDDRNHPQRSHPDRDKMNKGRDQMKYADYLHGQVRELLTRFDPVDILWFDFSFPFGDDRMDFSKGKGREAWRSEELYKLVRELAPDVVLDDRLDIAEGWDVKTPEQFQPREWITVNGQPVVWEACQTFSGSWGYNRDEDSWRSVNELLRTMIDCVSKGGNLLLNVGPTGRGEFDCRALDRLTGMGGWMKQHSRSIYGCTQAPEEFTAPQNCALTYNPDNKRVYIHLLAWPFKHLHLDGKTWCEKVEYAQLLNDASEIKIKGLESWQAARQDTKEGDSISLSLPIKKPNVEIPVIELFLK
ncbi:alpha-L-fucosidase [Planctomycetota bacterium]